MQSKKILSSLVVCFYLITTALAIFPNQAEALAVPVAPIQLSATSAILMGGARGEVLFSKNPNIKRAPASTTKVLTALVIAENMPLERWVTVPVGAENIQPSKVHLRSGEAFTIRSLLEALLLNSANDAAHTLAIATAGSQSEFAAMMNRKARSLGANTSHFVNPHGLPDPNQYCTSHDLAVIMRAAERNPTLVEIMRKKTDIIYSATGRSIRLKNHNKMLWRDPRDIIGKTGWTRAAKHCFVGRVSHGAKDFVFAVMGSTKAGLWLDIKRLIDSVTGALTYLKNKRSKKVLGPADSDTRKLQAALKKAGVFQGKVDGISGPKTLQTIKAFQTKNGLKADGVLGPKTLKLLKKYF